MVMVMVKVKGMNDGDKAWMDVNGEKVPVTILSTWRTEWVTGHTVELEADVQGCKVGDPVDGCYSYVSTTYAARYGIRIDLLPRD